MGYEKGKAWTATFNEILNHIIDLRNQKIGSDRLYADVKKEYGTTLGGLVQGALKLRRGSDERVVITSENEFLCSKSKPPSKPPSGAPAKPSKNDVTPTPGSGNVPPNQPPPDEYAAFWRRMVHGP